MVWRIKGYSTCIRLQTLQPRFRETLSILKLTEINGMHILLNLYESRLINPTSSNNQFYFCVHSPPISPWGFLRSSFKLALERSTWDWNSLSSWDALFSPGHIIQFNFIQKEHRFCALRLLCEVNTTQLKETTGRFPPEMNAWSLL